MSEFVLRVLLIVCACAVWFAVGLYLSKRSNDPLNITCYSPDLNVTYMSVEPVIMANEYGVWKFASGKGAYIQNSGDTCIVEKANEN